MTAIGVGFGRVIAIVALFCCGTTIRVAVDAFQTRRTEFSRPDVGFSTARQNDAWIAPRNQPYHQSRKRARVFATMASTASTTNITSTNGIAPEVFFPSMEESTKTRGRKRRAIQRLKQKHFSRPIDSRVFRTMLFPMSLLVWKPFWKIMDVFIARLEDESSTTVVNSVITTDVDESMSVSTAAKNVEDTSLPIVNAEDNSSAESYVVISEIAATEVATPIEATSLQTAASTPETIPETVEEQVTSEFDASDSENISVASTTPEGDRWAVAAPGVDLSGRWELIVTDDFKVNYDKYLEGLGQPKIVRSVALSGPVIGKTMEELLQSDQGRSLEIRGKNIRGTWDRTLVASGSTENTPDFEPLVFSMKTVDQEMVEAEAWWKDEGKSHVSWMRGVTMYGGGSFYSRRYFEEKEHEDDETVYVCEGFFEFNDPNKPNNELTWRFRRMKN